MPEQRVVISRCNSFVRVHLSYSQPEGPSPSAPQRPTLSLNAPQAVNIILWILLTSYSQLSQNPRGCVIQRIRGRNLIREQTLRKRRRSLTVGDLSSLGDGSVGAN